MSGTRYRPSAIITGTAKRNIIVVPCMLNTWLYRSGPSSVFPGRASCIRMNSAFTPPSRKKKNAVAVYRVAMDL